MRSFGHFNIFSSDTYFWHCFYISYIMHLHGWIKMFWLVSFSSKWRSLGVHWTGTRIRAASWLLWWWCCGCWPVSWSFAVVPSLLLMKAESGHEPPCPSTGCWSPRRPIQPPWPGSGGSFPVVCPCSYVLGSLKEIISCAHLLVATSSSLVERESS